MKLQMLKEISFNKWIAKREIQTQVSLKRIWKSLFEFWPNVFSYVPFSNLV